MKDTCFLINPYCKFVFLFHIFFHVLENALVIIFKGDGMDISDWLSVVHTYSWLLHVAFYFGVVLT